MPELSQGILGGPSIRRPVESCKFRKHLRSTSFMLSSTLERPALGSCQAVFEILVTRKIKFAVQA